MAVQSFWDNLKKLVNGSDKSGTGGDSYAHRPYFNFIERFMKTQKYMSSTGNQVAKPPDRDNTNAEKKGASNV